LTAFAIGRVNPPFSLYYHLHFSHGARFVLSGARDEIPTSTDGLRFRLRILTFVNVVNDVLPLTLPSGRLVMIGVDIVFLAHNDSLHSRAESQLSAPPPVRGKSGGVSDDRAPRVGLAGAPPQLTRDPRFPRPAITGHTFGNNGDKLRVLSDQ